MRLKLGSRFHWHLTPGFGIACLMIISSWRNFSFVFWTKLIQAPNQCSRISFNKPWDLITGPKECSKMDEDRPLDRELVCGLLLTRVHHNKIKISQTETAIAREAVVYGFNLMFFFFTFFSCVSFLGVIPCSVCLIFHVFISIISGGQTLDSSSWN